MIAPQLASRSSNRHWSFYSPCLETVLICAGAGLRFFRQHQDVRARWKLGSVRAKSQVANREPTFLTRGKGADAGIFQRSQ